MSKKKKRELKHIVYKNKEDVLEDIIALIEFKIEREKIKHYVQGLIECPKCRKNAHFIWSKFNGIEFIKCDRNCCFYRKRRLVHIKNKIYTRSIGLVK